MMRVVRVIVIEGKKDWVKKILESSSVAPNKNYVTKQGFIKEIIRTKEEDKNE